MDWKLMGATFCAVFFAEMGDKTQMATLLLSVRSGKPFQVFLAAAIALVAATAVGAAAGKTIVHWLPGPLLERLSASVFILVGVWMWLRS